MNVFIDEYSCYLEGDTSPKNSNDAKNELRNVFRLSSKNPLVFSKREAWDFSKNIYLLPSRLSFKKELLDIYGNELITKSDSMGFEVISTVTGNKYLSRVRCFFEYLKKSGAIEHNLFEDISDRKVKKKESEQRPAYDEEQIGTILNSSIFKEKTLSSYAWVVLIAILTGMRQNEICQLYRENILIKCGVWCFEITRGREEQRLKNKYSSRSIPIPSALISMGFLGFVKSREGHLFHEFYYSKRDGYSPKMSKWYSEYGKQWNFDEAYCFHSIRHYFTTKLKFFGLPECFAAQIEGHSHRKDTYGRYGKEYSIQSMKKLMDKVTPSSIKKLVIKRKIRSIASILF